MSITIQTAIDKESALFQDSEISDKWRVWMATSLKSAEHYMFKTLDREYMDLQKAFTDAVRKGEERTGTASNEKVRQYLVERMQPAHLDAEGAILQIYMQLPIDIRAYCADGLVSAEKYYLGKLKDMGKFNPAMESSRLFVPDEGERKEEREVHDEYLTGMCEPSRHIDYQIAMQYLSARLMLEPEI